MLNFVHTFNVLSKQILAQDFLLLPVELHLCIVYVPWKMVGVFTDKPLLKSHQHLLFPNPFFQSLDFHPSGFASNQPKQLFKPLDDFHLAEPKVLSSQS